MRENYKKCKNTLSMIGLKDVTNLLSFLRALPLEYKGNREFGEMIEPLEYVEHNAKTKKECPECGEKMFLSDSCKHDFFCVNCNQYFCETEA